MQYLKYTKYDGFYARRTETGGYELMHDQPYYDIWVGKKGDPNRDYVKHVPENQIERIKK